MSDALDARSLLRRIDAAQVRLRRALAHDHRDDAFWSAFGQTAPDAQRRRAGLRVLADVLHVERAARRGRLHGTRFPTLDAQAAWLAADGDGARRFLWHARYAQLPERSTLAMLREGALAPPALDSL